MSPFRLSERDQGSQFCRFERKLIFDPELKDVGFVHFLSNRSFTLMGSRFSDIDNGKVYIIPEDLDGQISQGEFLEIEPSRVERLIIPDPKKGGLNDLEYRDVAEVQSFRRASIPLAPPSLPRDEFIYRCSSNWNDAESDMLDIVISLLMVSSPGSVYGKGGLGSEGLEVMRSKGTGTPRDVSKTILEQLPVEFRMKGKSPYRYTTIDSQKAFMDFNEWRATENTYSILKPVKYVERLKEKKIPIQLPFVLRDSEKREDKDGVDLDVLDYQLTALYTPPPTEESTLKMGEELAKTARGESIWDGTAVSSIDSMAPLRIGLALTRLNVGKTFDGRGYSRKPSSLDEGSSLFRELIRRGLEEIEHRARKKEAFLEVSSHPWREKLKPADRELYYYLRTAVEETGVFDIPVDSISMELNQFELERSLERLNRYGYLLFMKGGTVIRLILTDSPEDSS